MDLSESPRQKYLVLTCNVEALPAQAADEHVERLIWGRFPDAPRDAGIDMMMDIADEFGIKMTFFHDVLEGLKYGPKIEDAGRHILDRGHDLQLNVYVEFLPETFWKRRGYHAPTWALNQYSEEAAQMAMEYAVERFARIADAPPLAFRSGSLRYNRYVLEELGRHGVRLSFQYNPMTRLKSSFPHGFDAGVLPVFRWSNGIYEVPMGCVENRHPRRKNQTRYEDFEFHAMEGLGHAFEFMERFYGQGPEHNVLVLTLHSWSFLGRDAAGHYVWKGNGWANLFRDFLLKLPPEVQVVSASQLLGWVEAGVVAPALEMPLPVAGNDVIPLWPLQDPEY